MKKSKIILASTLLAAALLYAGVVPTVLAATNVDGNQEYNCRVNDISAFDEFAPNPEQMELKEQFIAENEELLKNESTSDDLNSNKTVEKDHCEEAFEVEEEESNKNDLKAYEILSKYKGSEYARTDFITDYELDLTYMREMVKLIESGKLPKSEEDVLHKYVSRRAYWITDESVSAEFEKWMLG